MEPIRKSNLKEKNPPLHPNHENDKILILKARKIMFNLPPEETYINGYVDYLLSITMQKNLGPKILKRQNGRFEIV